MQRLFTTFPNGWPGAGLLLLRILCACPVLLDEFPVLSAGAGSIAIGLRLAGVLGEVSLAVGLSTPIAALLQTLFEVSLALAMPSQAALHLTRAAIGVALMGLGPGAWSLDSLRYGRKRIKL